jgi:hypothetical protein
MPLGERNVPLPPDNDGNEDVLTSPVDEPLPAAPLPGRRRLATAPRPARTGRHHGACPARDPGAAVIAR